MGLVVKESLDLKSCHFVLVSVTATLQGKNVPQYTNEQKQNVTAHQPRSLCVRV